ncbi:MAG: hypothetical protein WAU78_09300 [Roseiarcus sp.]|jgi:hypothetical protein
MVKSNSLGAVIGPEKTIFAPSRDKFRTKQSAVERWSLKAA